MASSVLKFNYNKERSLKDCVTKIDSTDLRTGLFKRNWDYISYYISMTLKKQPLKRIYASDWNEIYTQSISK